MWLLEWARRRRNGAGRKQGRRGLCASRVYLSRVHVKNFYYYYSYYYRCVALRVAMRVAMRVVSCVVDRSAMPIAAGVPLCRWLCRWVCRRLCRYVCRRQQRAAAAICARPQQPFGARRLVGTGVWAGRFGQRRQRRRLRPPATRQGAGARRLGFGAAVAGAGWRLRQGAKAGGRVLLAVAGVPLRASAVGGRVWCPVVVAVRPVGACSVLPFVGVPRRCRKRPAFSLVVLFSR